MSDKIGSHHLQRKAILYVRQSSPHQVIHNEESRRLQYAMRGRLRDLGWQEVEVVDDDLGRSASGAGTRSGFKRMVADVCLGKVGAVAAREASRFARNSREWQQLVEVCRLVDTLLIDQESVYAPRMSNDRLRGAVGISRGTSSPPISVCSAGSSTSARILDSALRIAVRARSNSVSRAATAARALRIWLSNPDNSRDLTNEKPPCGKKLLRADSQPRQGLLHVRSYHDTVFAVP